jgi:succinate dehydrogenase hydrophobic anchor subunit
MKKSDFMKSSHGSTDWFLEKFSKITFLPTALYIFFYFLLSYKLTHLQFYLNLFFINIVNIAIFTLFAISGGLLSYLRFKAILEDYVKSFHKKVLLKIFFINFNIFVFTFVFFTFIYFNFVISITTL